MNHDRLTKPFVAGLVTDVPDWECPRQGAVVLQDAVDREGVVGQRAGWKAEYATNCGTLRCVAHVRFSLSEASVTIEFGAKTGAELTIYNLPSTQVWTSANTPFNTGEVQFLPRGVYRDELMLCHTDGRYPMLRYSGGSALNGSNGPTTCTGTAGTALLQASAGSFGTALVAGNYVRVNSSGNNPPDIWPRILNRVSTSIIAMEGVRASGTVTAVTLPSNANYGHGSVGYTYPCIPIVRTGTVSIASGTPATVTGSGTLWNTGTGAVFDSADIAGDALLTLGAGVNAENHRIVTVSSDTSLTVPNYGGTVSNVPYEILRRCPFRDIAVAHECLFGTGVELRPNTVFVFPPGWNPALPPGAVEPFDWGLSTSGSSINPDYFRPIEIDVPGPYDGDRTVGMLSAEGIVLVIKENAVYGIYGSLYPEFSQQKIPSGDGNGAFYGDGPLAVAQLPSGAFWAGPSGVFAYAGGRVIDLTEGKINREWRDLMDGSGAEAVLAEASDHLLVVAYPDGRANGGQTTYQLNLRTGAWSKVSNVDISAAWSFGPDGKCYAADANTYGGTIDLASMYGVIDGSTVLAVDGNTSPTTPVLIAQTGAGIHRTEDTIDDEARLVNVNVTTNVQASTGTNPTLTVEHIYGDARGLHGSTADFTKSLGTISADATNRTDRSDTFYSRRTGRRHSIKFTSSSSSNARVVEIHEIATNFRKHRRRT